MRNYLQQNSIAFKCFLGFKALVEKQSKEKIENFEIV
jgi:hypothetical protein